MSSDMSEKYSSNKQRKKVYSDSIIEIKESKAQNKVDEQENE